MNEGHINLFRKLTEWKWYKVQNTKDLFIHYLLKANWKEGWFEGELIPRGSLATSRKTIERETGLSEQNQRTSEKHLKSTNDITIKSTNKFMVITIVNYEKYQTLDKKPNNQTNKETNNELTNNQQAPNNQLTTIEEFKEFKKEKKDSLWLKSFDEFWEKYPKKKAKGDALKSFEKIKLTEELFNQILLKLELFKKTNDWKKDKGQFIPYPATWLNQKRWEDEIPESELTEQDKPKPYGKKIMGVPEHTKTEISATVDPQAQEEAEELLRKYR